MTNEAATSLPKDKADLLARIQREWRALMQAVEKLTPEQMTRPGESGWSVKDNLAHLAAWEHFMLRYHLHGEPPHAAMEVDEATYERLDEDGMNAVLYERNKDRPVDDVLSGLRRSHEQVLAVLEHTTFADLTKPRHADDPKKRPVMDWVTGNTYEHYQEHRRAIATIVGAE